MANLLVFAMIMLYTCQSGFCSMYGKFYPGDKSRSSQIYSIFYGLIVGIVTIIIAGFRFSPSPVTLLLGAVNGIVLVAYNTFLLQAAAKGPYSIVMIFNLSGGVLLPLFYSVLVDGDSLSVWQLLAIAVMVVSFVLINMEPKSEKGGEKVSRVFILLCALLGIANGVYGILMNCQQKAAEKLSIAPEGLERTEMIIVTFAVSAVAAFILLLINSKGKCLPDFRQTPKSALFMVLASVSAAAAVNMMMYALSLINVAVLFTLDNGGVLLVSVLWSVIFYKEKLNPIKIVGLILAAASLVALGALH